MNQITHFHDGSNLYGSDQEDARDLRELRGGLMRSSRGEDGGKELLPPHRFLSGRKGGPSSPLTP